MRRSRIALPLLLAMLGLGVAACGGDDDDAAGTTAAEATEATAGGDGSTLQGSVGPGFDISLDGTDGITAGSYTIVVSDQAADHNFHLTGPGDVDVATDVGGEGEETFEVELQAGEYTFVCDPHQSQMRGTFSVG